MGLAKILLNKTGYLGDENESRLFRTFTALGWGNTLMLIFVKDCRDYQL